MNQERESHPEWLQPVEHTADAGIIVLANDPASLFARVAWGMFSILTDLRLVNPVRRETLTAEASDREALLVHWLSELNFRHVTRHELFCRFVITECDNQQLKAIVSGEKIDLERHVVFTEIKAITYHGLRIESSDAGWKAQVIFDL